MVPRRPRRASGIVPGRWRARLLIMPCESCQPPAREIASLPVEWLEGGLMRSLIHIVMVALLVCAPAGAAMAHEGESDANPTTRTMRPVIRGKHFAVASMKAEATRAADRILEKGG